MHKPMHLGSASGERHMLTRGAALPHSEVEVREFYKYIEQSLPEPRRMKQLLTWCGSRALPPKPSGDVKNASAIMAGMWKTRWHARLEMEGLTGFQHGQ